MLGIKGDAMKDKQISQADSEKLKGVVSLISVGEVTCDKCGKMIMYGDRYCCNAHECPVCKVIFGTMTELDYHFSQQHAQEPSTGTRYCVDCSLKADYLKKIKNKKTDEAFPIMFAQRDEETIAKK